MLLVRQLSPQALGVPDAYISSSSSTAIGGGSSYGGGDSGSRREGAPPYHETSRALGAMALCLTPQVGGWQWQVLVGSIDGWTDPQKRLICHPPIHPFLPQEMSDCLLTAVRVLHVEARLASGSEAFVDADTMCVRTW